MVDGQRAVRAVPAEQWEPQSWVLVMGLALHGGLPAIIIGTIAGQLAALLALPLIGSHLARMAIEYHRRTPRACIPHAPDRIQAAGRNERAVALEVDAVHLFRVALLEEQVTKEIR